MKGYKEPGFQDRVTAAASARNKALELLKNKPAPDPEEQARKAAARVAKEAAALEKREAMRKAKEEERLAKQESARLAAEAAAAAKPAVLTEAERKAARDLRYAARKARKS